MSMVNYEYHQPACWAAAAEAAVVGLCFLRPVKVARVYNAALNYEGNRSLLASARPTRHALRTDELAVCWRAAECCRRAREHSSRCGAWMLLETSHKLHQDVEIGFLHDDTSAKILQCKNMEYLLNADKDLSIILHTLYTDLYVQSILTAIRVLYPLPQLQ